MSANSGPGYRQHPEHHITTELAGVRVQVKASGEVVADTREAIRMNEANHPPVFYIPRKDVKMERLVRTSHRSYCPFKGEASYFSLDGAENAVWSYEQPYDEVSGIRDLLAFYASKVELSVAP